jgi:hypothetical protein
MGILDDLREEASLKQSEQQEDTIAREKLEHNYLILILPKMQQLFSYFKELLDYLKVIETPIEILQYSNRYPNLGVLYQQDYRLSTDKHGGIANFEKLTEITLRFSCLGKEDDEFIHQTNNKLEAEQEKDFLASRKLKFHLDRHLGNTKDGATTFHISRRIPVVFQFSVDYDRSRIRLTMHNHENFEQRSHFIDPNNIDEAFMDKLARYILRKDTEFLRMEIDESAKEKIRLQVEAQKQAYEAELEAAQRLEEAEQQNAQEKNMAARVKSLINKW